MYPQGCSSKNAFDLCSPIIVSISTSLKSKLAYLSVRSNDLVSASRGSPTTAIDGDSGVI